MIKIDFINLSEGMDYSKFMGHSSSSELASNKLWNNSKFRKKFEKARCGMYNCKSIKQFHKADQKFAELLKQLRLTDSK